MVCRVEKWRREKPVSFTSLNAVRHELLDNLYSFTAYSLYIPLFVVSYFHARILAHPFLLLLVLNLLHVLDKIECERVSLASFRKFSFLRSQLIELFSTKLR